MYTCILLEPILFKILNKKTPWCLLLTKMNFGANIRARCYSSSKYIIAGVWWFGRYFLYLSSVLGHLWWTHSLFTILAVLVYYNGIFLYLFRYMCTVSGMCRLPWLNSLSTLAASAVYIGSVRYDDVWGSTNMLAISVNKPTISEEDDVWQWIISGVL